MAYELANAIASGSAAQDVVGTTNGYHSGGRFSPDGSKIAVTTYRQGGAGSTDYGVDFFVSSSADGWHLNDSLDGENGSAIKQLVWYDTDTIFVVEGNTKIEQYNSSSVGGWSHQRQSANVGFTVNDIVLSPNRSKALVYGATSKLYLYTVSDSGAWTLTKNFSQVGHKPNANINDVAWIDEDNFIAGAPTANSNRGELQVYNNSGGTWSKSEEVAGSATGVNHYYLGDAVLWHASSSTIIAGATIGGSTHGGLLMIPSGGYGYLPASNPGFHGYSVNMDALETNNGSDPRRHLAYGLGLRQDPVNDNAILGGFSSLTSSPFDDGVIYTLESGSSEGWRVAELFDNHANHISSHNQNIDIYNGTAVTNNHALYNVDATFKVWAIAEYQTDSTAPTISSVALSADNSTATVTFSEAVYTNSGGSGDLTVSDFALGLSGGNSSLINLNATPSAISKTSQTVWVLTLNGTDLDFAPNGNETLVVDSASDTSIYDAAGNAHTAAHSGESLNDRTRFVKFRITNNESSTRFFYADVGGGTGDDSSDYVFIGQAAAGATLTSAVFSLDKFFGSGKNNEIAINSSTAAANLATGGSGGNPITTDAQFISYFNIASGDADDYNSYTLENSRRLVAYGQGNAIQNTSTGTDGIQTGSSNQNKAKYLNITRPSGGRPVSNQNTYGQWEQYDINNTQLDTTGPKLLAASLPNNTSLKLVFDSKPVHTDGANLSNANLANFGTSDFLIEQKEADGTDNDFIKRTTTGSLAYSTTSVTDDTITIPIDYEGVIKSGDTLKFRLHTRVYRDIHNNPGSSSIDTNGVIGQYFSGTLAYPSTGSTGTITYDDVNFHFVNSHESATAYFYMRVDTAESGTVGNNPELYSFLNLGTVAAGQTGSFAVSDIYFDDAKRGSSSPIHTIYAHTASVTFDMNSSPDAGTDYLDTLTLYQYSSSNEPKLVDDRRNFSASFDGSEFTTQLQVFVGNSSSELDYYVNTGIATLDSQSDGTGSITIDWGERVRAKTTSGTPSSVSDLSGGLPQNVFNITQNTGSTDTISNLRITDGSLAFATSARTGIASGSWTFTFNYDGLADGTERLLLSDKFEFYNGFYDDELNTGGNGEYWSELDTKFPDSWENFGTKRGFALGQDALATQKTEAITAADGGTVKAGGTNSSPKASVAIPANALSANTTIGVDVSDDSDARTTGIAHGEGFGEAISKVVRLTPHGTSFSSAVTVTFSLEGSAEGSCPANLQIWKRNLPDSVWYRLPSNLFSCSGGTITISTTSFSDFMAIGGTNMARTKLNNVQLARLQESNKVLPEAINITGSSTGLVTTVVDSDVFVIQKAGAIAQHVSGSALKTYFAGAGVNVTASAVNENYRLTFVDHEDTSQVGLAVDSDLLYNPSANQLTLGKLTASNGLNISGDSTFAGELTASSGMLIADDKKLYFGTGEDASIEYDENGTDELRFAGASVRFTQAVAVASTISGSGAATLGSTLTVQGNILPLSDNSVDLGASGNEFKDLFLDGTANIDSLVADTADINAGTIDNTAIGATTPSTIEGTTISGSGAATFQSTLTVQGNILPLSDNTVDLGASGNEFKDLFLDGTANIDSLVADTADIDGGTIDATAIGSTTPSTIEGTTISGSGAATFQSTLTVQGNILPLADNTVDLGASGNEFKDLFLDGTANIDALVADSARVGDLTDNRIVIAGASGELEDSGNLTYDGTTITLGDDVDLGSATSDTITATGRFDSNLVPSSDAARDLGTSALQWKDLYINGAAHIDALGQDLDAGGFDITNVENLTASAIQVQQLDVVTINSITQSETTLEIDDKLIVSAVSASSANADGGGLRIGGGEDLQGHASVLWNHASSSLDLTIGDEAQLTLKDGALLPSRDDNVDLGSSTVEYKDLYLDGIAYMDNARVQTVASGSVVLASDDGNLVGDGNITFHTDGGSVELQVTGNVRATAYYGDGANLTNVGATIKAASSQDTAAAAADGLPLLFASGTTSPGTSADLFVHAKQIAYYPSSQKLHVSGNIESAAHVTASQVVSTGDVFVGGSGNLETSNGGNDHAIFPTMDGPGQTLTLGGGSLVSVAGAFDVVGATTLDGNVTLGDATSDTITATGRFASDLVPSSDGARDLGSTTLRWSHLHVDTVQLADELAVTGAASFKGAVTLGDAGTDVITSTGRLTASAGIDVTGGDSFKVAASVPSTFSGQLTASNGINVTGIAEIDKLKMPDNTSGKILVADGTSFEEVAMSGDVAIASSGATTIQAGAVEHGMLNDNIISGQGELAHADIVDADDLMIHDTDAGVVKKVGVDSLRDHFFGVVSGDLAVADGGAATIQADAVESGMLNDNVISGQTELAHADIVDADELMISDGGVLKKVGVDSLQNHYFGNVSGDATIADGGALTIANDAVQAAMLNDDIKGNGVQVSNGVLSITAVQDIASSGSKNSILSADLVTASLQQDMVTGSLQVYLNGMLQTPSGSVQGGAGLTALFDYELITTMGPPEVHFAAPIDSDDVVQLRYIKK